MRNFNRFQGCFLLQLTLATSISPSTFTPIIHPIQLCNGPNGPNAHRKWVLPVSGVARIRSRGTADPPLEEEPALPFGGPGKIDLFNLGRHKLGAS